MPDAIFPKVTPRDFSILENLLEARLGSDELLVAALRRKLREAQLVFSEDLPADVATIDSRILLRVDERLPEERTLVTPAHYIPGVGHQSIATPRGVMLLGLTEGESVDVDHLDRIERVEVLKVLYQPEAERQRWARMTRPHLVPVRSAASKSGAAGGVTGGIASGGRPGAANTTLMSSHDDDPGPAAA
ncbi:nucleoside-diphosphate kinase [Afifella sp. H1R]|uniref:nucleoside-diphosphate kinase n=1 Tax=Afifella sp. H1R TaxID=2908841 RepID=UPI001F181171|nr:nucleoside-diphosphate kinase [Afifella sp. H1R]MCF1505608.1 nucleoside-diphosphate kinase [Afifella sp. H1R]